jgi:hypothetical protein
MDTRNNKKIDTIRVKYVDVQNAHGGEKQTPNNFCLGLQKLHGQKRQFFLIIAPVQKFEWAAPLT